jgi:hypothetical protein
MRCATIVKIILEKIKNNAKGFSRLDVTGCEGKDYGR